MDNDIETQVMQIFDNYVKVLQKREQILRHQILQEIQQVNQNYEITNELLEQKLPNALYNLVNSSYGLGEGDWDQLEKWLRNKKMDKNTQDYFDKTIQGFLDNKIDLFLNSNQARLHGVIFESMGIKALQQASVGENIGIDEQKIINAIREAFDFEGIGYQKQNGDVVFKSKNTSLDLSGTIDFKLSTGASAAIRKLKKEKCSFKFDSIDSIQKQIINEVHKGMGRSIPASGRNTQSWYSNIFLAMEMNINSPFALENYYRLIETGMAEKAIAIYIFKTGGYWSSQIFRTLSYNVSRNAKKILTVYSSNNLNIKNSQYNKNWLWYGTNKDLPKI